MSKEDVEKANVYSITITMYAGDMFQICYGGGWDGQVGIGLVEGAEYCDGVNFYDNNTYTAADKKVAQVKNEAGEVIGSKQNVNGKTRKDHRALMDNMIRMYSSYKETLEKKNMGFAMNRWDEKLLKYGELILKGQNKRYFEERKKR